MEKLIYYILFLLLVSFSCKEQKVKESTKYNFDVEAFKNSNFDKQVETFVSKKIEVINESYMVVFANSKEGSCLSCVKNNYGELLEELFYKNENTYIFINDSVFFNETLSSKLNFIYLPTIDFERNNVFHQKIYLYKMEKNKVLESIEINATTLETL